MGRSRAIGAFWPLMANTMKIRMRRHLAALSSVLWRENGEIDMLGCGLFDGVRHQVIVGWRREADLQWLAAQI